MVYVNVKADSNNAGETFRSIEKLKSGAEIRSAMTASTSGVGPSRALADLRVRGVK